MLMKSAPAVDGEIAAGGAGGLPPAYDEALDASGEVRPHYRDLLEAVRSAGPAALCSRLEASSAAAHLSFSANRFRLDPLPRLLEAGEWELLGRAATQRAAALNLFLADIYGERQIVEAGVVPERVITGAEHYEPAMCDVAVAPGGWATVIGFDLVRDPSGAFRILEDNARSPSGIGFASAARRALVELDLPGEPQGDPEEAVPALGEALRAAAPQQSAGLPSAALLSEGPESPAFFEHELIAGRLGIPILTPGELREVDGRLQARVDGVPREIDILYRRTDGERLTGPDGRPTELGGLLLGPLRAGTLACVNAFGSGVVDDKLTHAYVGEAIRFYLGEDPLIDSVPTFDLGDPPQRAEVLQRLPELAVKPRSGLGGGGVLIGPLAGGEQLAASRREIEGRPERFIAQETISLSTHPSAIGDQLLPRHIDLRPYAISVGDQVRIPRSALTRFAPAANEMIVNSSRGGGAKDTWVLA
ncbi:MAG: circularly permuted type 2 ATP-grasp protein [Solirubrobacterales bacterium]